MIDHWLPPLVLLNDHNGDWSRYLQTLYEHFTRDFLDSLPTFRSHRMGLKRYPEELGKVATFWHLISEGKVEAHRTPDFRRCERICWPRPMIEQEGTRELRVWRQMRGTEKRVVIGLQDFSYILILAERNSRTGVFYLPWTAYCIEYEHQRQKLRKEWELQRF